VYNKNSMSIQKAHWQTEGDNVRLSMPFSKVDQERRIVSGFATLDNIDKQADVVTTDASMKAFEKFRGNIREMHQPIAVGKMLSFKEDKYFDPETKKFYSGVYVSAYISKGAQDCWEKVMDGTYSGFSIGGRMNKWDDAYDEKMDAPIRIIKDYDLMELSLVDTPANQFANILSIEKNDNGDTVVTGEMTELETENVFWDKESGLVMVSANEFEASPATGEPMQNIGFVEKSDVDKLDMVKFLVDSAKGTNLSKMNEEDEMTDEIVNDAPETAEVVEEVVAVEEVAPEADAEVVTDVEKAVKPEEEVEPATPEEDAVEDAAEGETENDEEVKKSDEGAADAVTELKDAVTSAFSELTTVVKSLSEEIAELKKSVGHIDAKVNDAESDFNNLGKRIDAVEADTAFRKSGDLGEIVQEPAMVEKSVWGGRFLNTSDLLK
jgi:hypothetical protein